MAKTKEEKAKLIAKIVEKLDNKLTKNEIETFNFVEQVIDLYEKENNNTDDNNHDLACKIVDYLLAIDNERDIDPHFMLMEALVKFTAIKTTPAAPFLPDEKTRNIIAKTVGLINSIKKEEPKVKDSPELMASIEELLNQFNRRKDIYKNPEIQTALRKANSFDMIVSALKPYLGNKWV